MPGNAATKTGFSLPSQSKLKLLQKLPGLGDAAGVATTAVDQGDKAVQHFHNGQNPTIGGGTFMGVGGNFENEIRRIFDPGNAPEPVEKLDMVGLLFDLDAGFQSMFLTTQGLPVVRSFDDNIYSVRGAIVLGSEGGMEGAS